MTKISMTWLNPTTHLHLVKLALGLLILLNQSLCIMVGIVFQWKRLDEKWYDFIFSNRSVNEKGRNELLDT
ncbi:hypothetical protein B1B00_14710 [Bacillus sp. DSM 27956]|nr:hypothetical protein B1B00_14710 [Bacillus sp. DSM 27956]